MSEHTAGGAPGADRPRAEGDASPPGAAGDAAPAGDVGDDRGAELRRELLADGWEERFGASGARLEEATAFYRSLGYEVRVELLNEVAAPGSCTQCFSVPGAEGPAGIIFTRAGVIPSLEEEELFDG